MIVSEKISSYISLVLVVILVLGSCTSKKNIVEIPVWTSERPILSTYYIGIAAASKYEYPYNAIDVARENALNSMAREIRVQVSSSSILSTLQVNNWVEDNFESTITSTVAEDLEGYTLVDSFEDEHEVWVYYRLSKSQYSNILAERKLVALGLAYGHYIDATRFMGEHSVPLAIERYLIGLDGMSKYLGELNPYTSDNGVEFDLDRALLNGLSEVVTDLKITCSLPQIDLLLEDGYKADISVAVNYDGVKIGGVPLKFRYSRGAVPISGTTSTSGNGQAHILLHNFDAGTTNSELIVEIDVANLISILKPLSPLEPLVKNLNATPLILPLYLESPRVRVVGTEKLFGRNTRSNTIIPAIKSELIENGVEVVENASSDVLTLRVESDTRVGGEGRGFYTAYLNATIALSDPSGELILQKNLENIKGVQTERIRSGEEAYRKASKDIKGRFVESFVKSLYK